MTQTTKLMGRLLLASALTLGAPHLVSAHHSASPHFDNTIDITKTGIVTEWKFVNPHSYIYFDVSQADGSTVNWRCESTAAAALLRLNYSDETFVPGMKITVFGNPARREDNVCLLLNFAFDDGVEIARNGVLPDNRVRGTVSQAEELTTDHEKYTPDGTPNFEGYWVAQRRARPAGGGGGGGMGGEGIGPPAGGMGDDMGGPPGERGSPVELTAAGKAAEAKYEQIYDDPSIKCGISNIIFGMGHDQNVNHITQTEDKITFLYGFMDYTRTIYLDGRDFPETITPTEGGYSIGQFEGDTLVVRTKGFLPSIVHPLAGGSYSDQMESVERFSYDETRNQLSRDYVLSDPLYFIDDYEGSDAIVKSAQAYTPYNCIELSGTNNLRPGSPEYIAELARVKAEAGVSSVTNTAKNSLAGTKDMAADAANSSGLPSWLLALGGLIIAIGGYAMMRRKKD